MQLERWGWCAHFQNQISPAEGNPARVIATDRGRFTIVSGLDETTAVNRSQGDPPTTGDWVVLRAGAIVRVLHRKSALVRNRTEGGEHVLAANIDLALLVAGLDHDFNPRRLERYLVLIAAAGIDPVILLNKGDLMADPGPWVAQARRVSAGWPVLVVSGRTGQGIDAVESLLEPGRTAVLLGSSGAGKSTLVNRLLGEARFETQSVREHDSRGRHTTTARQLVMLPCGGLLIDTPGLRQVGLPGSGIALDPAFPDIAVAAEACRFRDCRHQGEPGCAVTGAADPERIASYAKLQRELDHLNRKGDPARNAAFNRKNRALHKAARRFYSDRM